MMTTEDTLSGFQDFSLQPIIKDRSNKKNDSSNIKKKLDPCVNYSIPRVLKPNYHIPMIVICILITKIKQHYIKKDRCLENTPQIEIQMETLKQRIPPSGFGSLSLHVMIKEQSN